MKKLTALFLIAALFASLAGCAGTTVVVGNCTCPPDAHKSESSYIVNQDPEGVLSNNVDPKTQLKTGIAILTGIAKSASATAEANGKADYDVTVVAVTVDYDGMIHSCIIDSIGETSEFTAEGVPVNPGITAVKTKREKGLDYGMKASGSQYEWYEQADALARFAVGKTVDQVKGGYAEDVDLATSASIYLGGYVAGIEAAVANARHLGAGVGDELRLAVTAAVDAGTGGKAQMNVDAVALTLAGDVITSCFIDSLQAAVEYDSTGTITTDVKTAPKTKMQLGFDYGMVAYKASKIGLEWFEQVDHFCDYVTGKTVAQVSGIAVNEEGKTTDVDLAAECSIAIDDFQALIAKAFQ